MKKKWCMCTKLEEVAINMDYTCIICKGKDAYGISKDRPINKRKVLDLSNVPSFTVRLPKQYTLDMEKIKSIEDVNTKLNALFTIFYGMNIVLDENVITEDLKPFVKLMEE